MCHEWYSLSPSGHDLWGEPVTVIQSFTATGDWVCPTGVTEVEYLLLRVEVGVEVNHLVMLGLVEVVQAGLELAQGYLSQQERLIPLLLAGAVLVRLREKTTEVKVLILLSLVRLLQKTQREFPTPQEQTP
jgi:hypothetical protein